MMSDEDTPEIAAEDPWPAPDARRRHDGIDGTPIEIGGTTWLLADYVPLLGAVWNRLFDQAVIDGRYEPDDVHKAAMHLLIENYRLSASECAVLLLAAPLGSADEEHPGLVAAVERAMFGEDQEQYRSCRTYSQWMRLSLLANGLDPEKVPARDRRPLVLYLVAAGKAAPPELWVGSAATAFRRAKGEAGG
jgi:hypothetical protein